MSVVPVDARWLDLVAGLDEADLPTNSARCHVCHREFDPSIAHDLHEEGCTRASGICRCDLRVCPGCCPECEHDAALEVVPGV